MAFERYHIGELMGDVHGNDITYLFVTLKKIECFLSHFRSFGFRYPKICISLDDSE